MNKDIETAINNLGNHSLCVAKDDSIITNDRNGISPLMYIIANNINLQGYSLADEYIGKAAALLASYVGIVEIYTPTISQAAIEYLNKTNIKVTYENTVEFIMNRKKDGPCIMEQAIKDIDDPKQAYEVLKDKLISIYGKSYE